MSKHKQELQGATGSQEHTPRDVHTGRTASDRDTAQQILPSPYGGIFDSVQCRRYSQIETPTLMSNKQLQNVWLLGRWNAMQVHIL